MTPPDAGDVSGSRDVDPEALVSSAIEVLTAATTLAALDEAQTDLLGKRSPLARAHQALVSLEPGERPEAGRRLNEARRRIESQLTDRRRELERIERAARLRA